MSDSGLASILLVDDELEMLEALVRGLHRMYSFTTACEGHAALEILRHQPGFAVLASDLRMPGMGGIEFLRQARQIAPDTVRILFTGHADLADAVEAVNEGFIYRLLTKPCPLPKFKNALDAADEQYHLITAERVLWAQTRRGSVKALTDVLALVSPLAFGRGMRARQYIADLASHSGVAERWPVEVAAMLSQIGCVALPVETLEKLYHGQPVTKEEQAMIDRTPAVADDLLANIPRLEPVREILRRQHEHYGREDAPRDGVHSGSIAWGARALKIIFDLDAIESQGVSTDRAFGILRSRGGWYDSVLLKELAEIRGSSAAKDDAKEIALRDVHPGMVFVEDVKTVRGLLLIARGQKVTLSLLEKIVNLSPATRVQEPVRVIVPSSAPAPEDLPANDQQGVSDQRV